jgi:hypothetical protein
MWWCTAYEFSCPEKYTEQRKGSKGSFMKTQKNQFFLAWIGIKIADREI